MRLKIYQKDLRAFRVIYNCGTERKIVSEECERTISFQLTVFKYPLLDALRICGNSEKHPGFLFSLKYIEMEHNPPSPPPKKKE